VEEKEGDVKTVIGSRLKDLGLPSRRMGARNVSSLRL
jgi:hypothetical protein